ncbi:MAG: hypothetical protein MUF64_04350 [Polyangiaceae bacterium]|nr:hypothetical protein [Polyangiaceae bacterium]
MPLSRRPLLLLGLAGCGFQTAREASAQGISVALAPARTVEVALLEGSLAGARRWFQAQGVPLHETFPRLWIEVFEPSELPSALLLSPSAPLARGVSLVAQGRASWERSAGAPWAEASREQVQLQGALLGGTPREDALRALGLRLGEALARLAWG